MKTILVVLNPLSNPWRVLNRDFNECPTSLVKYSDIYSMDPVPILQECPKVKIKNTISGESGTGFPIEIEI